MWKRLNEKPVRARFVGSFGCGVGTLSIGMNRTGRLACLRIEYSSTRAATIWDSSHADEHAHRLDQRVVVDARARATIVLDLAELRVEARAAVLERGQVARTPSP